MPISFLLGWFATFDTLAPNVTISRNAQGNYDFNNVTLEQIRRAINGICDQLWSEVPSPNQFRPGSFLFRSWLSY